MFDLGMMEILVIGVVALIVVGPKDLPGLFRTVGKFVGKLKGMAREFQRSMDDAGRASGMSDVMDSVKSATDGVKKATSFNPLDFNKDLKSMAKDSIKKSTLLDDDAKEKALKKVDAEADKTASKPAAKKVAKKPAVKKPVAKKPAVKKPTAKKAAVKKAAPKKPTAKKPASKKPAKKTTIKKDA